MEPIFFASPSAFRRWLEKNHDKESELWVGFHKKATGKPSMTWPESVDEALCFGWIDGLRKSVDADRYRIRFTPRRPRSTWSAVNIRRVEELTKLGRMRPPGLAAFERRSEENSRRYSYEQGDASLGDVFEKEFRRHRKAWAFFQSQPPGYRRLATSWVISAKREETRRKRLGTLIDDSAAGLRIAPLRRTP